MNKKDLPVIPSNRSDDLHNLEVADSSDLVLFMAGNQFMAMGEIISAFQKEYHYIKRIFYETLHPILSGGAVFGDKILDIYPDVYTSVNEKAMKILEQSGHIDKGNYHLYLHNRLILMVVKENPARIDSVTDLARDDVRISQPDPENEDIAFLIMEMYRQAGGDRLVHRIMEEKRAEGTTIFTVVHHRETPLRIAKKTVDVGPVWATEAIHARSSGLAFDVVEPGEKLDQRDRTNYYICKLKNAPHPDNAGIFLDFIASPSAQEIYKKYGFEKEP
jgi:molybdate transport system substrate-binding protein